MHCCLIYDYIYAFMFKIAYIEVYISLDVSNIIYALQMSREIQHVLMILFVLILPRSRSLDMLII